MATDPFVDPLRFLMECHGRIRLRLATLRETAASLRGEAPIPRHHVEAALLFFQTSGAAHTVDEEESLFPRLRARLEALRDRDGLAKLDGLEADHRRHEGAHRRLEASLRELDPDLGDGDGLPAPDAPHLASGSPAALAAADAMDELVDEYEAHIPIEDDDLFPAARRALAEEEIETIAREMRRRHSLGGRLL